MDDAGIFVQVEYCLSHLLKDKPGHLLHFRHLMLWQPLPELVKLLKNGLGDLDIAVINFLLEVPPGQLANVGDF